jgi:predicted nucleic acid-binding protein
VSEIVVDASVALCWFARENDTVAANRLIRSSADLIAPSLMLAELANSLWKKARLGEIDGDIASAAMNEIRRFIPQFIELADLAAPALALARELDHSVYDCFYLALARRRAAPFVTLDRAFVAGVAKTRYERDVVHLADWT